MVCLEQLFRDGVVRLHERPRWDNADTTALAATFAEYRLTVAGPLIAFDAALAESAARVLLSACWFLVSHREEDTEVEGELSLSVQATTASHHLSADLLFRYLPQVYRRARAIAVDDVLTLRLAQLLREWPLSGVLSDVNDGPAVPPDFDGHPGLQLLYAERLACHEKSGWAPAAAAMGHVELVCARLGRRMPWAASEEKA